MLLPGQLSWDPAEPEFWKTLKHRLASRAAVMLHEDFRDGLTAWDGVPGWRETWSFDQAGFARVGSLGVYRPSVGMEDFSLEFLGQVEQGALNWTLRTVDRQNYHVVRIVLVHDGAQPRASLIRQTVLRGSADEPVVKPLPFAVRHDTLYHIRTDVQGDHFAVTAQGRVVDSWRDNRLGAGGVGFLSTSGERARIRWVRVRQRQDAVGKLCALLASPEQQLATRKWAP